MSWKQSKEDIEKQDQVKDHWGYQTNPDDQIRKKKILEALDFFFSDWGLFERALDIGGHEGWISKDLPAKEIDVYELSDMASNRLPENCKRVFSPTGEYDLIIATGVMYEHYDYESFLHIIEKHSKKGSVILLCNIKEWEVKDVDKLGAPMSIQHFPYREYTQQLKLYVKI